MYNKKQKTINMAALFLAVIATLLLSLKLYSPAAGPVAVQSSLPVRSPSPLPTPINVTTAPTPTVAPAVYPSSIPARKGVDSNPSAIVGANANVPAYTQPFRYGINFGWQQGWDNLKYAAIAQKLNITGARIKLPEWLFDQYGYNFEIENKDMATYQASGLLDLTAFLTGPVAEHSNSPDASNLEGYSPKNLYEPIWSSPGEVNPNNYWADYVFKTVSTYKSYVKIWEIWNEPDFVYNWQLTQKDWWEGAPNPKDLTNWHDTIFSYIRLMRISYEVIKQVDPTAYVAPGGLGYESYLDALLSYTDNPADGSVTDQYPARGGAYFDMMSFHSYPQYATKDFSSGTWYRNTDSDAAADAFIRQMTNMRTVLRKNGYDGVQYPEKLWLSTETGLASKPIGDQAGSPELMQNYLAKMFVLAQSQDIKEVHWYQMADTEEDSASKDSNSHMGLYYTLEKVAPGNEKAKPASQGYSLTAQLLNGKRLSKSDSAALKLPDTARGYVFIGQDNRKTYVLWSKTSNNAETAETKVTLNLNTNSPIDLTRYSLNISTGSATNQLKTTNGTLDLTLTATPTFLVQTGGN